MTRRQTNDDTDREPEAEDEHKRSTEEITEEERDRRSEGFGPPTEE